MVPRLKLLNPGPFSMAEGPEDLRNYHSLQLSWAAGIAAECARTEDPQAVKEIMKTVSLDIEIPLHLPDAPFHSLEHYYGMFAKFLTEQLMHQAFGVGEQSEPAPITLPAPRAMMLPAPQPIPTAKYKTPRPPAQKQLRPPQAAEPSKKKAKQAWPKKHAQPAQPAPAAQSESTTEVGILGPPTHPPGFYETISAEELVELRRKAGLLDMIDQRVDAKAKAEAAAPAPTKSAEPAASAGKSTDPAQ